VRKVTEEGLALTGTRAVAVARSEVAVGRARGLGAICPSDGDRAFTMAGVDIEERRLTPEATLVSRAASECPEALSSGLHQASAAYAAASADATLMYCVPWAPDVPKGTVVVVAVGLGVVEAGAVGARLVVVFRPPVLAPVDGGVAGNVPGPPPTWLATPVVAGPPNATLRPPASAPTAITAATMATGPTVTSLMRSFT
jgi:hypothetical protein